MIQDETMGCIVRHTKQRAKEKRLVNVIVPISLELLLDIWTVHLLITAGTIKFSV